MNGFGIVLCGQSCSNSGQQ